MARLSLTLLGGFQARLDSGEPLALPTRKAQALLAYLALPVGQAHPRDKLAAIFWGGIHEASARASLRQAVFALRRGLRSTTPPALRLAPDSLALDPAAVAVDVCAFEQLVAEGTPAALEAASRTYRGDLLNGVSVDEAPFEEWLVGEQERLRELAVQALARLLAHQRKSEPDAAVQTALKLLSLDPLQEPVHRTLMRLYADHGRRAAALRQYRHCVEGLQRELGVGPEADTKQLYQEILARRATRSLAAPLEAEPGRMPLIGRDKELARLNERLDRASR